MTCSWIFDDRGCINRGLRDCKQFLVQGCHQAVSIAASHMMAISVNNCISLKRPTSVTLTDAVGYIDKPNIGQTLRPGSFRLKNCRIEDN